MSIDKDLSRADNFDDARRIRRDVRKIVGKPERYQAQGKKVKRAIFWNGKVPANRSPKGFVVPLTPKKLDRMNIERLFFGKRP